MNGYVWTVGVLLLGCCQFVASARISQCSVKDCYCEQHGDQIELDCSVRNMEQLPEWGEEIYPLIHSLDLSENRLTDYPTFGVELAQLTVLDLSDNQIEALPNDDAGSAGLAALRILRLKGNKITSWSSLRGLIANYANLEQLNLAGNPLTSFSSFDPAGTLHNENLRSLDLSDCRITKITGQHVLRDLPRLEQLILHGNPLRSVSDMISVSLLSLDLSNCRLTFLQPNLLQNLPALREVNLSRNSRVSLSRKADEFVHSESLQRLDLSYCNMDTIEIGGFPNLTTAVLRGNLINRLRKDSFEHNAVLEDVDLSANAITHVSSNALQRLPQLKRLDLSFNMIRRVDRETFRHNEQLTSINLSRNFIERMSRIDAQTLTHLNMSWCEVLNIDLDAFNDMPELLALDLSNNLFAEFPVTLHSAKLQALDLSMCRLSHIRNETFVGFPDLAELRLSGNRFTTPFRMTYFAENPYLHDIWLGDNPWRCDCNDNTFYSFFNYLTEGAGKLRDYNYLRCLTPEEAFGELWEVACAEQWFTARSANTEAAQRVWTFLMLSIVLFVTGVCLIMSIRRCIENRLFERREEERERNLTEAREIMRRNQSILEQEAQLNAPDPRESRPPCYEDAILLPKFSGSFASLRAKFRSEPEDNENDETDGNQAPLRNRSRSEEVLSPRESVIEQNRQTRRQIIAEANTRISIYPVLEIPPRFSQITTAQNHGDIPLVPLLPSIQQQQVQQQRSVANEDVVSCETSDDVDRINLLAVASAHLEMFDNSQSSPYAQRRGASMPERGPTTNALPASETSQRQDINGIQIVDDHYSVENRISPRSQRHRSGHMRSSAPSSDASSENSSIAFTIID